MRGMVKQNEKGGRKMEKLRTKIMMALAMLICCMCLAFGGGKEVQVATYEEMTLGQWVKSTITEDVETRYYPMRRKTPCFSYGDIRRVHRIYASN